MNVRQIFLCAIFAVLMLAGADRARAQFFMGGIGQREAGLKVEFPMEPGQIDAYVLNETEALVQRKTAWNAKNNVDFYISLTGMTTQLNKSWQATAANSQNSISGELFAHYYHTYTRNRYTSIFKFDGVYGMNYIDDAWFKNQDMLSLYYLVSWKLRDKGVLRNWANSFSSSFLSQFAEGYKSRTEDELWSNFLAPGTLNLGAGFTYTSSNSKWPFIVTIDPASIKTVFVMDEGISSTRRLNIFGDGMPVTYAPDDTGKLYPIFKNYKLEGGSNLNVSFNRTFALGDGGKTLQYNTTLRSFYGWMTQLGRKDGGTAADMQALVPTGRWVNTFVFKPLKFMAVEFRTTSAYNRSQIDKVQMEYYLRVGLSYSYKNR
jgi:hypothetical protein